MPNQAMAITARISAGICAPWMPKLIRLITGNGTPVFCPMYPDRFMKKYTSAAPIPSDSRICQPPRPRA
ncbi:hypothetical protein D3C81_2167670 [compost metagenome]